MLCQSLGEQVLSIFLGVDIVVEVGVVRIQGGVDGIDTRVADGSGRQSLALPGVVGAVEVQIRLGQLLLLPEIVPMA